MGLLSRADKVLVPDINAWGTSVQAAVTAIRQSGATSQMILLPGSDYTSAAQFISDGSAAALSKVTNLDGSPSFIFLTVNGDHKCRFNHKLDLRCPQVQ